MRKKAYKQITILVDNHISDIHEYFNLYIHLFENKAKETKNSSYGGYELKTLVNEFNNEINQKCSNLMREIETIFANSGRKLSHKQYVDLIEKCVKPFNTIESNFATTFKKEFNFNETLKISLLNSNERISKKINDSINTLNILSNTKIDKALIWTAIGTILAGISLILSIVTIIE